MSEVLLLALTVLSTVPAGMRYFWISADGLESTESIDRLVNLAASCGANGVIVQVMGRGEAWYRSEVIPEAYITAEYDPLARVILIAKPLGLEVHAWVNAFLSWSAPWPPADSTHVLRAHPEWFMADLRGRSTISYSRDECDAAGIVGATLSPAIPEVRARLASICVEIAEDYDIDGIHLDYIRYPNESFGFESAARADFFMDAGVDPVSLFPASGRSQAAVSGMDGTWRAWRAEQVTRTVRTVRAALRSVSPTTTLSCAVMADPHYALQDYACAWRDWIDEGLVDFACPMAYTTDRSRAGDLAVSTTVVQPGKVVYGIAVYNQSIQSALVGAGAALDNGAGGVCIYSANTFSQSDAGTLKNFWGGAAGDEPHHLDPSLFHMTARLPI